MPDSKYFQTTHKGEIHELREELKSTKEDRKKEAVKKVMTVGKDVSALFPDVVNCMQTNNLELKKLVYLYVMNYAKSQPQRALMVVNTFQKDARNANPMIRALAVRTMGCIRVNEITEYLCDPLRDSMKDIDPYVRKTAAVCVAKLYAIDPDLVERMGFLDLLNDLLADSNPMVVSNVVASLSEIHDVSKTEVFKITTSNLNKLLAALNECTEWGQVFILDSLAKYSPRDSREAESITERVAPRLQHSNSAVVLAAVKVLMKYMDFIFTPEVNHAICKKMTPPLVTLLSKQPEIQFVALRNINLIVQKRPDILQHEMKVFFCKYNDPHYVKMEKLEIMMLLVSDRTVGQVLNELKEYATEVDVEFVRKSVRAIGRCAIKLEKATQMCVQVLLDLKAQIQTQTQTTRSNYVVQEALTVIKDIFRKYPNKYESIIATLCADLDTLDEPEAKSSMIWIIGEYAERIDNAAELLGSFLENFKDENSQVQLQLLTAVVKLFLKRPTETQDIVQEVIKLSTSDTDNPDLRDRGFIYWRLLSSDPEAAKSIILTDKPLITDSTSKLDEGLLNDLIPHISTLSSVYHKPPESFIIRLKGMKRIVKDAEEEDDSEHDRDEVNTPQATHTQSHQVPSLLDIELGDLVSALPSTGTPSHLFAQAGPPQVPKQILLTAEQGRGMQIAGAFNAYQGRIVLDLTFTNFTPQPMGNFMILFDKNAYSLAPAQISIPTLTLRHNQAVDAQVALTTTGVVNPSATFINIAVKNNIYNEPFFFTCGIATSVSESATLVVS